MATEAKLELRVKLYARLNLTTITIALTLYACVYVLHIDYHQQRLHQVVHHQVQLVMIYHHHKLL